MAEGPLTKEAILQALDDFCDPESGRSIVRLQQVHGLELSGGKVAVTITAAVLLTRIADEGTETPIR